MDHVQLGPGPALRVTLLDIGTYIVATVIVLAMSVGTAVLPMLRAASIDLADVMHR